MMDYSLLVGIHDCERLDRYSEHMYVTAEESGMIAESTFGESAPLSEPMADGSPDESGLYRV